MVRYRYNRGNCTICSSIYLITHALDSAADSTELVDETERFEQALQVEEEGGIQFEPFSLKQEREEGYFDESGNYVERKTDEDDKDAWLASDGGAQPCCTHPTGCLRCTS
jgi:hypothetical protein